MPEGPAAEPRRAPRRQDSSSVAGTGQASAGARASTSGLSASTGSWGDAGVAELSERGLVTGGEGAAGGRELAKVDERFGSRGPPLNVGVSRRTRTPGGCLKRLRGVAEEREPLAPAKRVSAALELAGFMTQTRMNSPWNTP